MLKKNVFILIIQIKNKTSIYAQEKPVSVCSACYAYLVLAHVNCVLICTLKLLSLLEDIQDVINSHHLFVLFICIKLLK